MSPGSGRSQAACNSALDKAIRNAVGSPAHETGAQGLPNDGLSVMGCGTKSPKGTQGGNLGGSPTSRPQGSRKLRETDSEEMSAMGLTVQRMETAKAPEQASEMEEPQEPQEPQEGEAKGLKSLRFLAGAYVPCQAIDVLDLDRDLGARLGSYTYPWSPKAGRQKRK